MKKPSKTAVAAVLAITLSAVPLAACGGQASQGGAAGSDATEQTQTADIDSSSWKTLGDALAYDTKEMSGSSWDEEHYITVFAASDGSVFRVVAKMDADVYAKHEKLDMSDDDYEEKFLQVMGGLELESVEDLTPEKLSQDQLDAYVGKTGKDLVDDGFTFEHYWMYGGEETGATMAKGNLAYSVTFDVTVPEDKADSDEAGDAIMDAAIVSMEFSGASNDAVDPAKV